MRYILFIASASFIILITVYIFVLDDSFEPNVNHKNEGIAKLDDSYFYNRYGDSLRVSRGSLVVPESREGYSDNKIQLHFKIVKSISKDPGYPIFFLAGGPGIPSTEVLNNEYFYLFIKLRKDRDIVLIDQRGTGQSIPNLNCDNKINFTIDESENVASLYRQEFQTAVQNCTNKFKAKGIHLPSYNSKESAFDIDDLRSELGYSKIILYGYSYGSELAQFYIRHFERYVERAIFAGPQAPDHNLKMPQQANIQYEKLDSLAQSDRRYAQNIPGLIEMIKEVKSRLNESPVQIKIQLMDAIDESDGFLVTTLFKAFSYFKPHWNVVLSSEYLELMNSDMLGSDYWNRRLPSVYWKLYNEDYTDIGNRIRNFAKNSPQNALFFATSCATGFDDKDLKKLRQQEPGSVVGEFALTFFRSKSLCNALQLPKIDGLNEPVFSEIPLLLIGGTLDGRTPLPNLNTISERFPNSYKAVVINAGHYRLLNNKIYGILDKFVNSENISKTKIPIDIDILSPVGYKYSLVDTLYEKAINETVDDAFSFYTDKIYESNQSNEYLWDTRERTLLVLGHRFINEERYNLAIQTFKRSMLLHPDYHLFYRSLSEVYLQKGKKDSSKVYAQKAIRFNYFDVRAHQLSNMANQ